MRPRSAALAALLLLLLAAAAAVQGGGSAAAAQQGLPPPAVLLHLSDIHYSVNVKKYWRLFGDREGDAALFSGVVVPRLAPQAVLVTGDLTDSKTARGEGLQQEAEWAAYGRLLANLSAAGVPRERVLDLPGNHDAFNTPSRGGPLDRFERYAAEGGRRASPLQRVFVHQLPAPGSNGDGSGSADSGSGSGGGCPAAWLLGLDPTPAPGLRSPTNFAGQARPAMLAEAAAALRGIADAQPPGCGPPTIIAYCHYPLSTIDSTPPHAGLPGILLHATHRATAMQGLTQLLAEHNVSAAVSGHLHSAFGERLHRLHTTPGGGHMAELETAAWKDDRRFRLMAVDGGVLSFVDLFFHSPDAPRMPKRPDAPATADPAWRDTYAERGWAVTALDPAAVVIDHIAFITSPPDGRYSPLGTPQQAAGGAAAARLLQQEQQQGGAAGGGDAEREEARRGLVRALVLPLDAAAGAAEGLQVELVGHLPDGPQLFAKPMQLQPGASSSGGSSGSGGGGLLYAAQAETTISCVGAAGGPAAHCHAPSELVMLQVSVRGAGGSMSRSPRQPAALRCAPLTAAHQACWVAPVAAPLPLGVTFLEWLGLAFNWPVLVHRIFLAVWLLWVGGLLVAPRLLAPRVAPLIAASPLLHCQPAGLESLPSTPKGAAGGPRAAAAGALRTALAWLLWPVAALFVSATVTEVWGALLAYALYVLLGPWLAYDALSGYPPALLFSFGALGRLPPGDGDGAAAAGVADASWRFIPTCDTFFVTCVHSFFCLLPATLWVACVVARRCQLQPRAAAASRAASRSSSSDSGGGADAWRRRMMESGGVASSHSLLLGGGGSAALAAAPAVGRWSFSGAQLAAFAGLACFNVAAMYIKAGALMGGISLALSPGFAWTLPLALALVVAWGGPRRPCGRAAKGE